MRRLNSLTFVPLFWATSVAAQDINSCDRTLAGADCTPVYACIDETGEWFKGQALGQTEKGLVKGVLASGANCIGKWVPPNAVLSGKLDLTCNNGTYMQVYYTQSDPATKTAIGQGISLDGQFVTGWSGKQLKDYFLHTNDVQQGGFTCGPNKVPLG